MKKMTPRLSMRGFFVVFGADGKGTVIGATAAYVDNEAETVAKSVTELVQGDKIDFICDYYRYDGTYDNSYKIGEQITYVNTLTVTDLLITGQQAKISYRFTDMYNKEYWTDPVIK